MIVATEFRTAYAPWLFKAIVFDHDYYVSLE